MKRGRSLRPRPAPTLSAGRLAPLALAAAAQLLACKTSITATPRDGGSGGNGGDDAARPADALTDRTTGPQDSVSATETNGETCATATGKAEPVPLDLYMVMDSSKSMEVQTTAGTTKWDAVKTALMGFFTDASSAGISVGMVYFPKVSATIPATCADNTQCGGAAANTCDHRSACVRSTATNNSNGTIGPQDCSVCASNETCALIQACDGGQFCLRGATGPACMATNCKPFDGYCHLRDLCGPTDYSTPDVPIAALPAAAPGLASSLSTRTLDGYTPTGPALRGAIEYAQQRAMAMRNRKIVLVLVTDGLPGGFIPGQPPMECMPSDVAAIQTMLTNAATGAGGMPAIPTFVIGVFAAGGTEAMQAPVQLGMLATGGNAGGNASATAVVITTDQNVTAMLQAALAQIRTTTTLACEYAVPPMGAIDPTKVNFIFNDGTGSMTTVPKVNTKADCGTRGGWYYDVTDDDIKNNGARPKSITACETTCNQLQAATSGEVNVQLGCQTVNIM